MEKIIKINKLYEIINKKEQIILLFSKDIIPNINKDYTGMFFNYYLNSDITSELLVPYLFYILPLLKDKYNNELSFANLFNCYLIPHSSVGNFYIRANKGTLGFSLFLLQKGINLKKNKIIEHCDWLNEQPNNEDIKKAIDDVDKIKEIIQVNKLPFEINIVDNIIQLKNIGGVDYE